MQEVHDHFACGHNLAKGCIDSSKEIVVVKTIAFGVQVVDVEADVLLLFEHVRHLNLGHPFRIQGVLDALGPFDFLIVFGTERFHGDHAHGIGLAEHVHVEDISVGGRAC